MSSQDSEEPASNPPFPPAGVSPDSRSPQHPDAEAFINAAAQHIVPEHPAPREGEGADKDVMRDGVDDLTDEEGEREEELLIGDASLEEMKAPILERGSFFGSGRPTRGRGKSRDTIKKGGVPLIKVPTDVPEDEELAEVTRVGTVGTGEMGSERPGFGVASNLGSVSLYF